MSKCKSCRKHLIGGGEYCSSTCLRDYVETLEAQLAEAHAERDMYKLELECIATGDYDYPEQRAREALGKST